jgi:hypothetical protein
VDLPWSYRGVCTPKYRTKAALCLANSGSRRPASEALARSLVRSALQCRTSITQADRRFGHPSSEIFSTHIPPKPRTGVGSGWLGCVCVWELLAMRAMRACRCVAPLGRGRFQSFFVLGVSLGFVARRRACRKSRISAPCRVGYPMMPVWRWR